MEKAVLGLGQVASVAGFGMDCKSLIERQGFAEFQVCLNFQVRFTEVHSTARPDWKGRNANVDESESFPRCPAI
jgi:hypothetical protein